MGFKRSFTVLAAAVLALSACGPRGKGPAAVDAVRLANADAEPGEWMSNGRTYDEQRFSPLTGITDANIGQLGLAWSFDLDTNRGQEATPIVVDGVMYVSTAWSKVKALDAATGRLIWEYDPQVPGEWAAKACCDVVNRGVAVWEGKVFVGALDGRLLALDARNGKVVWEVNTVDRSKPYSITGAPRVVKGKVLIGNGGAEFGVRGYLSAYDAQTGEMAWRFYTVPGDPKQPFEAPILEKAAKTWTGEWWKLGGGGTVWDAITYDPELDLIYIGTGNGSPWNQAYRSPDGGENLFLASIVALRPDTGQYVWHYQVNPSETWDYTATQPMILADLPIGEQVRKVLMQAPKNGFFYVIDRETGKFISANNFVPVNWASGIDPKTGKPIENPEARFYRTPGKVFVGAPGPFGAHSWHPMAFNPRTGLVYIPAQELDYPYIHEEGFEAKPLGINVGIDFAANAMPNDPEVKAAALAAQKGELIAWDPVGQREVWRVQHKGAWNGGVLTTAGNLVLQGDATGALAAYRADNGARLWSFDAQTGVIAAPMTYEVRGEQYIAVMAGWGGVYPLVPGIVSHKSGNLRNISRVLVFKLGGAGSLPPAPPLPVRVLAPPPETAAEPAVQQGKALYARYCTSCHGDAAVSGGITPDLRYSAHLAQNTYFDIVLNGALKDNGMVSFSPVMDRAGAEAVRAYIVRRAHESLAEEKAGVRTVAEGGTR